MFLTVQFDDFRNKEQFLKLQNRFQKYDERSNPTEDHHEKIVTKDFTIIYKDQNDEGEDNYVSLAFYSDFLYPAIKGLAKRSIDKILTRIQGEFKYKPEEREEYIKSMQETFSTIEKNN